MILAGKKAFVTGAGRGIGRAIAIALAEAGADVAVNDHPRSEDAASTVEAVNATGRRGLLTLADVADRTAVERAVADTVAAFGRLDITVLSAVYSDRGPFHEVSIEGFEKTIQISMWGAFYALRASSLQMMAQGDGGSIVMISSSHAYMPIPLAMAYNMAKAANDQMARTAAIELVKHRIRVNLVHPGWTDTPGERKYSSEERIKRISPLLPWGRMCKPEEVARGVVFLCDPASDYITGSVMQIDGGVSLPWWASSGSGAPE